MNGLKVSELARRCGVPATTVRFYDREGLLPARRSASGYRLYDDDAVHRLAFIGTAKSLGLPLPEIRRLLVPWRHGHCADVRSELAPLVDRHLERTRERIAELAQFAERLVVARDQLGTIDRDGPCDPSCAFLGRSEPDAGPEPATSPAIACRLTGSERATRVDQWREVLATVRARETIDDGVRLTFTPDTPAGPIADLAASEARCCPFFGLTLTIGPPLQLDATAPRHATVLVHELFGDPAG